MPSLLEHTREALGGDLLPACESRALRLTRYARPELNDKTTPTRLGYLQSVVNSSPNHEALQSWQGWLPSIPAARHLHARLGARMLINMAGSVLENAGLNLDRHGVAFVPGSAVKACARRTALATLKQWTDTGEKPTGEDLFTPAAAAFASPGELHLAILRVFGCTDLEWQPFDSATETGNDLAWACGGQWEALRTTARATLNTGSQIPSEFAPIRRGSVAFLPAYPAKLPLHDLELDVLTPHHREYYEGKRDIALDNEDPVPVFFPAVAAETDYTFALLPVGSGQSALLDHAATWLRVGLETFGLGAKNNAGYGWFTDRTNEVQLQAGKEAAARRAAAAAKAAEETRAAELATRKAREDARKNMTTDQRADADLADRAADWGWMKPHLMKFAQHPREAQAALLRWFNSAGRERWLTEIKPEAAKGRKPWSQIIGAIHAAKKIHKIDLP